MAQWSGGPTARPPGDQAARRRRRPHLPVEPGERLQQRDGGVGEQAAAAALKARVPLLAQRHLQVAVLSCSSSGSGSRKRGTERGARGRTGRQEGAQRPAAGARAVRATGQAHACTAATPRRTPHSPPQRPPCHPAQRAGHTRMNASKAQRSAPSRIGSPSSKNEMTCPLGIPGSTCTVRRSGSRS